jgi:uncharacterized protein DUF3443/centrosomal CEP192-like protein
MHGATTLKTLAAWLALASALAACGGGGGGGGATPVPLVSLSASSLAFGAQATGTTSTGQSVTVNNIGTATLTVSSVTFTGTNASVFGDTTTCASVAAGSSCTVTVTFAPASAGSDVATLDINTNAAGSPSTVSLTGTGQTSGANTVATLVDTGPLPMTSATINVLYATVTICAPGTTNCQVIDHIQVDTGSTGLRILSSVLTPGLAAALAPVQTSMGAGHALVECTQFADGYSWGPIKTVDLTIGTQVASGIEAQVIGDGAYPSTLAPSSCVNGPGGTKEEDTVAQFGANGIIGIGYFLQDCGFGCPGTGAAYNDCTASACTGYAALVSEQVPNPVSKFASNNNGVVIELPAVAEAQDTATGVIVFGVGSGAGSLPAGVTVYQVNPGNGEFTAGYNGASFPVSFIDSGSNGWFFPNQAPALALCANPNQTFYCPNGGSAMLSASIHGQSGGPTAAIAFTVYDLSQLFSTTGVASGLSGLPGSLTTSFDFGLPFFYGRPVYVGFEGSTLGGQTGPAVAF